MKFKKEFDNIDKFKNIHAGKRCFIMATGPSIEKQDLSLMKNDIVIGCNLSILNYTPNYLGISDNGMWTRNRDKIINTPCPKFVCACKNVSINNSIYMINRTPTSEKLYKAQKSFSKNLKLLHYAPSVVLTVAIPLAWHMGFKSIFLIGCDCTRGHFYDKNKEIADKLEHRNKPAFHGNDWKLKYWRSAKVLFELSGGKIYNATHGGNLDIFKRVEYESLFK